MFALFLSSLWKQLFCKWCCNWLSGCIVELISYFTNHTPHVPWRWFHASDELFSPSYMTCTPKESLKGILAPFTFSPVDVLLIWAWNGPERIKSLQLIAVRVRVPAAEPAFSPPCLPQDFQTGWMLLRVILLLIALLPWYHIGHGEIQQRCFRSWIIAS